MAIIANGTRDQMRAVFKVDYDVSGDYTQYGDFSQTFSYVKETATYDVKKAMVDAIMSLTVYNGAPYKVYQIETSELVVS